MEGAIANRIGESYNIHARQYGFQSGLSPTLTLMDVNALIKAGWDKIATLDLTKSCDRVNRY